jgi:hypothetical protein
MGGVADAFSGSISTLTGKASKDQKPDEKKYKNPYQEELMARILGAIDRYNDKRGVNAYIPKEQRPYELRSDEERAGIRAREPQQAKDERRPERNLGINEPNSVAPSNNPVAPDSSAMVEKKLNQAQEEQTAPAIQNLDDADNAEQKRRALNAMLKDSQYAPKFRSRNRSLDNSQSGFVSRG